MIDVDQFIDRFNALTSQEKQALDTAITPEVGEILMKVMPELQILILPLMEDGAPTEPVNNANAQGDPINAFSQAMGGR